MNVDIFRSLIARWRSEANFLAENGADAQAKVLRRTAAELELDLKEWIEEPLTLTKAAEESGFHKDTLQHRVANGDIANAGEVGAPRILRVDLPTKGGPRPRPKPELVVEEMAREMGV